MLSVDGGIQARAPMQNLRDKLLKAGLVSEDQAKKIEESAKSARPDRPRDDRPRDDRPRDRPRDEGRGRDERRPDRRDFRNDRPARPEARSSGPEVRIPIKRAGVSAGAGAGGTRREPAIPKLPPMPGSREHQRLVSKKQVELDRKIRELVTGAQVAIEPGEQTFYFVTRKQRLRRLELSAAQHALLESGELAVVERPDPGSIEHALVPAAVAAELLKLSEKSVRFLNKGDSKVGFISEDELKTRQDAETSGAAETQEAEASKQEAAEQQAEIAQEGAAAEASSTADASTEATPSGS